MKKTILVAILATFALGANAQAFDNMFISVGAGTNIYSDRGQSKGGANASFAADLSVGNWFTPAVGARVQWAGVSANKWNGLSSNVGLNTIHADFLWNLSNTFNATDPVLTFVPFVGVGPAFVSPKGYDSQTKFAIMGGLLNQVRLSDALDLNLELRGMRIGSSLKGVPDNGVSAFRRKCVASITVGLTYNFGR